MLKEKYFSKE